MGSRASLNKVLLIGNLTRDPELRYTPSGAAVCTFGLATNRTYVSSDGTKKEEAEFMRIVAWNKLGELCSQLLTKGRKVYVEGRLQTRSWETPDGQTRQTTEVVIDDMRILDSRRDWEGASEQVMPEAVDEIAQVPPETAKPETAGTASDAVLPGKTKVEFDSTKSGAGKTAKKPNQTREVKAAKEEVKEEDIDLEDLPF